MANRFEQFVVPQNRFAEFVEGPAPREYEEEIQARKASMDKLNPYGIEDDVIEQGVLMGAADEIAGVAGGLGGLMRSIYKEGEGFGKGFAVAREAVRDRQKEYAAKHPGRTIAARVVGGMIPGVGAAKAGLTAFKAGQSIPMAMRAGAIDAGAMGAAGGFASGEGLEGRLWEAGKGGLIGAGIGMALPPAVALGKATIGAFGGNAIAGTLDPKGYAQTLVARAQQEAGMTPKQIRAGMTSAKTDAQGDVWALVDQLGYPGQRLLAGVTQSPSMGRKSAFDFLKKRQAGQGERIGAALEDNMGTARTAEEARASLIDERDDTAKMLYGDAREQAGEVDLTDVLAKIDEELTLKPNQGKAERRPLLPGTPLEQETERIQSVLREVFSNYPPPNRSAPAWDTANILYREAFDRGLIGEVEQAAVEGLGPAEAAKRLGAKLDFLGDLATEKPAFVRSIWDSLDIPDPKARSLAGKEAWRQWSEDRADQLNFAREQAKIGEREARKFSEQERIIASGLANDDIAHSVRKIRGMLADPEAGVSLTDFGLIFRVKKRIDDMIDTGGGLKPPDQGGGHTYKGSVLAGIRKEIDKALEAASKPYRAAADMYRADSKRVEAVVLGEKAAKGTGPFAREADNIKRYKLMSPAEQEAFRAGYVSQLLARVEKAPGMRNQADTFSSMKTQAELRAFSAPGRGERLPRVLDRESTMHETRKESFLGSPTARNLNDQEPVTDQLSMIANLLTGQWRNAGQSALSWGQSYAKGYRPQVREEVIRMLMQLPGKHGQAEAFKRFQKALTEKEARDLVKERNRAMLLRGLYGGMAAQ